MFFMSGADIYDNFQQGRGPEPLAAVATELRHLVGEYEQQAQEIVRLTTRMESAWQGTASGAAQRGAGPLAVAHLCAAPRINTAQDLSARQVESFGTAKNAVRPVPPAPTRPDPFSMIFSVDAATTYAGQLAAHNAAAQHNVDVMEAYESASAFNAKGQPQSYGTIEPDNGTIVVRQPPTAVTVEKLEPVRPNVSRKTDTHQDPHWTDTDGKVTDNRGGYDVGGSGDDAVANRGGRELGHTVTSGVPDTPEIPVDPVDGSRVTNIVDARGNVGVPVTDGRESAEARGGPPGRDATDSRDNRGGLGAGTGGPASARRGGFTNGRGGVAREGVPVVPGRGKEDDEEHRTPSFLREVDPDSVFGTDQRCAPPVIE
ncbi:hypothetical protein GCM10029964_030900 [Kibdelosporangium lantanae]